MNNLIKTISFAFMFFTLFSCGVKAEEFEIEHADLLEADKQQITIKGNVIIKYKNTTIEAPFGKIDTDSEGKANNATFTGRVRVKLKDRKLEADKIDVLIKTKEFFAYGNTISELKDKKNNILTTTADYQHLLWAGQGADGKGNLKTTYLDTMVNSDKCEIVYKNNKPSQVIFSGDINPGTLEQPSSLISAKEIIFDIKTQNIHAIGSTETTVWPDKSQERSKQDPVHLNTEEIFIDNEEGVITAKDNINKVKITYEETKGQSKEAFLLKNKETGKPEKIIFKGSSTVTQPDKELSGEEVVFDFTDKKLTSTTQTSIRPKTIIFRKEDKQQR